MHPPCLIAETYLLNLKLLLMLGINFRSVCHSLKEIC